MSSTKKNPHIEQPSNEELERLLAEKPPELRQIYLKAHEFVVQYLPEVKFSVDCTDGVTGYAARQYGYNGWGLGALAAHTKWVSLMFMRGADLADPHEILEGTGKNMRYVKLRSLDEFEQRQEALEGLLREAASING